MNSFRALGSTGFKRPGDKASSNGVETMVHGRQVAALGTETSGLIRSTLRITSVAEVVLSLLENALDAGAKVVEVELDLEQWSLVVRDNGTGMRASDLSHLGERYWTTKAVADPSKYGFRGEGLASICQIANIEIASRHCDSSKTYRAFWTSQQGLSCGQSRRFALSTTGTEVHVRNLFYNLPVRRKSILHAEDATAFGRQRKAVQRVVQRLALAQPDVSFSLSSSGCEKPIVSVRGQSHSGSGAARDRFGQVINDYFTESCTLHDRKKGPIEISAFVSRHSASSRSMQHIILNSRHLSQPHELYHLTEDQIRKNPIESSGDGSPRDSDELCNKARGSAIDHVKAARGYPVFLVYLTCPWTMLIRQDDHSVTISEQTAKVLMKILKDVFAPDPQQLCLNDPPHQAPQGPRTRASRLSSTVHQDLEQSLQNVDDREYTGAKFRKRVSTIRQACAPFLDRTSPQPRVVARRNFNSTPKEEKPRQVKPMPTRSLKALRQGWHNPAFVKGEIPPPSLNLYQDRLGAGGQCLTGLSSLDTGIRSISRDNLMQAQVIGQVDAKFIAVRVSLGFGDRYQILLIDQHAADERVRIELILSDFLRGSQDLVELEQPLSVRLSVKDRELALEFTEEFKKWGIIFHAKAHMLELTHCPPLLSERLTDQVDESILAALIREHASRCHEDPHCRRLPKLAKLEQDWTADLAACPRQLVDIANSKACRGSVMFGDVLSMSECSQLVKKLSQCRWPFQCAHGRPSTVPLFEWSRTAVAHDARPRLLVNPTGASDDNSP